MLRDDAHFMIHVDEVEPALVRADEGGEAGEGLCPAAEGGRTLPFPESWREVDIRFLITRARAGTGSVCLFRAVFPPGAAHEPHLHPNADEFFYVVRGRASLGAGDHEYEASAGTAEFVPAGRVHWLRNLDPSQTVEVVGGYLGVGSLEEAGYRPVEVAGT